MSCLSSSCIFIFITFLSNISLLISPFECHYISYLKNPHLVSLLFLFSPHLSSLMSHLLPNLFSLPSSLFSSLISFYLVLHLLPDLIISYISTPHVISFNPITSPYLFISFPFHNLSSFINFPIFPLWATTLTTHRNHHSNHFPLSRTTGTSQFVSFSISTTT